ncbi:radical SAM protein [Streptacidiphilus sp. MAP5-3]|uniref:B12-binding domain-containing radical SAM protein n=1 Tax=unclassified Streptacidiphilus TaxID=2643834 RepID=UPI0035195965
MPEQPEPRTDLIAGADPTRLLDAVFVNAPLRDYEKRPRVNDYTLPVLGMAYIATYARQQGLNVGLLDAEAHGLSVREAVDAVNTARPRWVGMNLLAPTYELSARIASEVSGPDRARLIVGGHHAKAMPNEILADERFKHVEALVVGEGETRVAALLGGCPREQLPRILWDQQTGAPAVNMGMPGQRRSAEPIRMETDHWLSPDVDKLTLDRDFLPQDPYVASDGRTECNIVGSRGCPYDCGFCGAAVSKNGDLKIRTRSPEHVLSELFDLQTRFGATAFRFVDDLFLGAERIIRQFMDPFAQERIGDRFVWDATGRINVLHRAEDSVLDRLADNGLREVALGIESGSDRVLAAMDKRITCDMTLSVARRLMERGIGVKGYFILGYPGETADDLAATMRHVRDLWHTSDRAVGTFRASAFEFRPYPGTPIYDRLVAQGHDPQTLMDYGAVDLTDQGADESMRQRDEFNFSVGIQFTDTPLSELRRHLAELTREQHQRNAQVVAR